MRKSNKIGILLLLLLLAIGFSVVTTNLIMNNGAKIGTADLDVYFSEASAEGNSSVSLSSDRKTITYSSETLESVGDRTILVYRVMNNTPGYDANVSVLFNAVNTVNNKDYSDYYSIELIGFEPTNPTLIGSKQEKDGKIIIKLAKVVTENVQISFSITLNASAVERTQNGVESDELTAAEYLTRLSTTDNVDMATDDPDGNVRYIGRDPNNYVSFNGEEWRIVGVFDGRLKIRREQPLNSRFAWDYSYNSGENGEQVNNGYGINDWSQADLMYELNGDYLNYNLTEDTQWAYYYGSYTSFDHTQVLKESAQELIDDAVWYLGAPDHNIERGGTEYTAQYSYLAERAGEFTPRGNSGDADTYERQSSWTGKVGLLYPSDFGYATSGSDTMSREECLAINISHYDHYNSFSGECGKNQWIKQTGSREWLISGDESSSRYQVLRLSQSGYISGYQANSEHDVRPVVYLKADVKFNNRPGENGTKTHPYTFEGEGPAYYMISGDYDTPGSEMAINNEHFYVLKKQDSNHVVLLAKYSLYIGDGSLGSIYQTTINPTTVRWADGFSWSNGVSSFPADVYTNAKTGSTYKVSVAEYVEKYVEYIKSFGVNATGRLITMQDVLDVINDGESLSIGSYFTNASNYTGNEWIATDAYWTGTANSAYNVITVEKDYGYGGRFQGRATDVWMSVRPAIILEI